MRKETRERLILPILVPVGALAVILGVLWGFSRILLSVTANAATGTAIAVAFSIVVFAGIAASRPQVRFSAVASMAGAVAGVAMLAGGIALVAFAPKPEGGGAEGPAVTVALVAKDLQFAPTELSVPAGAPFDIAFDNQDATIQHNVQIFDNEDRTGTPLFDGDLVTGVGKATYTVHALDAGTYYFHCVVHPTMIGTIEVTGGGGPGPGPSPGTSPSTAPSGSPPGGGGPPPSGSVSITASGIQFDTSSFSLPADGGTIEFTNEDAGTQHNIAIYQDSSVADNLFRGDFVTGVATATYTVPPIPPGTYYFQCDVHSTMNGSVTIA